MTQSTVQPAAYRPRHKLRFVTATALFDGHDASINIMRRMLQASSTEVIHLGHNRSVGEIVAAAVQEDVHGIAVTSYQGGHVEFFRYLIDELRRHHAGHIRVFGGGGGVIIPAEIAELQAYGVTRIYSPQDGQTLGLQGMINEVMAAADCDLSASAPAPNQVLEALATGERRRLAQVITALENQIYPAETQQQLRMAASTCRTPVLGITGTGGAGKSSLTDELVRRLRLDQQERLKIGILSIDPSRRRSGGALLGDRIRMNAIDHPQIYMRSLATRDSGSELCPALPEVIAACKLAGFDLLIIETSGIGQGNAAIAPLVDVALYVMTPEFGAASQLEKIDMLDFADFVAINKFDRKGAADALRDVRKQYQRNHQRFAEPPEAMPVFGTMAARFNDAGVTALYRALSATLWPDLAPGATTMPVCDSQHAAPTPAIVPAARTRYLAEIATCIRDYRQHVDQQIEQAQRLQALRSARQQLAAAGKDTTDCETLLRAQEQRLDATTQHLLNAWPATRARHAQLEQEAAQHATPGNAATLSGLHIPRVALPRFTDDGALLRFLRLENLPGHFPYTAGVFEFRRENEDPTRMFAGEGDAQRTNRRFHQLSADMPAKRLSTAFDSVTLYGCDPDERPDIYGKIGNSGVSIATLDDMRALYAGFDLCAPNTSVSMTINGPAPIVLAMYFNAAIDQQTEQFTARTGRTPDAGEYAALRQRTLSALRGTVQADILKEDQGQNTCIFSTEFALRMMGDIQEYFIAEQIRNFYSVSISGYHIAEAGANPISQLAFTLANGFTYVEAYLARGMAIDDFAPNLSFFFSNGMDPEYSVIGRVARRIWAVAMQQRYGANERSQKLKYHVQTSGRSLHAQEMDFNDIRTTLQALTAIYDNCNSLHTNAYDEAVTTPTDASVRRALAIQLIINREWGLAKNQNPLQGAFIIDELTDLVEAAVLKEFEALAERGGVLGAMETGYQRSKIQEESLEYERRKHDGSYPIVGVNTFRAPQAVSPPEIPLARSSAAEKQAQIERLRAFQQRHAGQAGPMLAQLQQTALAGGNIFAALMDAVRVCSLGQLSQALFAVGGEYRRNM